MYSSSRIILLCIGFTFHFQWQSLAQDNPVVFRYEFKTRIPGDISFSPDGSLFGAVTGEEADTGFQHDWIRIWDTSTWEIIKSYGRNKPSTISLSPDNSLVAFAYDRRIDIHDLNSDSDIPIKEFRIGVAIWSLSFSPDGLLLIGSTARHTRIWDTSTWEEIHRIQTVPGVNVFTSEGIDISPDSRFIAYSVGEEPWGLSLYETRTGNLFCSVPFTVKDRGSKGTSVSSVDYSPDGTQIVTTTIDIARSPGSLEFNYDWIRIIDSSTCEVTQEFEYPHERAQLLQGVRFVDDNRVVVGSSPIQEARGNISLWNISNKKIEQWQDHPGALMTLDVSSDKSYLASIGSGADTGSIIVWEIVSQTETGIDDTSHFTGFAVSNYPNPVSDYTIFIVDIPFRSTVSIRVFDILGRDIMSIPSISLDIGRQQEIIIDDINLPAGVYLYRIIVESGHNPFIEHGQFIKQ